MDRRQHGGVVGDWMTRRPAAIAEDASIAEALERMRGSGVRHVLVFDGDRLTGLVSSRDLGRLLEGSQPTAALAAPVTRIMTEGPVTAAPETPVTEAARLLLEQRIGALPVRDGEAIVGIFTIADALEALLAIAERHGA